MEDATQNNQDTKFNGISIIVCCYNSELRISTTLEHLASLNIPTGYKCELILVDNNSSDNTLTVAKSLWEDLSSPYPLITTVEKNQGLIYARHNGIEHSSYDIILFVDDDNWLDKEYLTTGMKILSEHDDIGILGGFGDGAFETKPPLFFYGSFPFKSLHNNLAVSRPEDHSGFLIDTNDIIYGAGAFYRREVFNQLDSYQFQSILTGRKGKKVISGEDAELCYATKILGYKLFRSKLLKFKHYIPSNRLTSDYFSNLFHGFGYSSPVLSIYTSLIKSNGTALPSQESRLKIKLKILFLSIAAFVVNLLNLKKYCKVKFLLQFEKGKLSFLSENQAHYKNCVSSINEFYKRATNPS